MIGTGTRRGSGTPWERDVGYSRVVRVGPLVEVSGTTSTGSDGSFAAGSAYEQAARCIRNVELALRSVGATMADVTRTRMYVTDISQWQAFGRAHGEAFADIRPATSMVEVRSLIDPRMLIEMEATAYIES